MTDSPYRKVPQTKFKLIVMKYSVEPGWAMAIESKLEEMAAENWEPYLMSEGEGFYSFLLRRIEQ